MPLETILLFFTSTCLGAIVVAVLVSEAPFTCQDSSGSRKNETPQDRYSRRLANSTFIIAFLTFVIIVVSFLQFMALQGQLKESKSYAHRQLRAYMLAKSGNVALSGVIAKATVIFKNGGQTPAYNVTRWCSIRVIGKNRDAGLIPLFRETGDYLTDDVGPADDWPGLRCETSITATEAQLIGSGENLFDVSGVIKYRDSFHECQMAAFAGHSEPLDTPVVGKWGLSIYYHTATDSPDSKCDSKDGTKTASMPTPPPEKFPDN